jgi:hypothetical protein
MVIPPATATITGEMFIPFRTNGSIDPDECPLPVRIETANKSTSVYPTAEPAAAIRSPKCLSLPPTPRAVTASTTRHNT